MSNFNAIAAPIWLVIYGAGVLFIVAFAVKVAFNLADECYDRVKNRIYFSLQDRRRKKKIAAQAIKSQVISSISADQITTGTLESKLDK